MDDTKEYHFKMGIKKLELLIKGNHISLQRLNYEIKYGFVGSFQHFVELLVRATIKKESVLWCLQKFNIESST